MYYIVLYAHVQVFSKSMMSEILIQRIDMGKYISLYSPALEWLLYGLAEWSDVSSSSLDKLIEDCKNTPNR